MLRRVVFIVLLFAMPLIAMATDTTTVFCEANWMPTTFEKCKFVRKIYREQNAAVWNSLEYFKESGIKYRTGQFTDSACNLRNGVFVYYYDNGQKQDSGTIVNRLLQGTWVGWYKNGSIKYQTNYNFDGDFNGYLLYTVRHPDCMRQETMFNGMQLQASDQNKMITLTGMYDGECKWYHPNGVLSSLFIYKGGIVESVKYWNENSEEVTAISKPPFGYFSIATFKGGSFKKFLSDHFNTPNGVDHQEINIRLSIGIDELGKIIEAKVVYSSVKNSLIADEFVRVIKLTEGMWENGKAYNLPIKSYVSVNTKFEI